MFMKKIRYLTERFSKPSDRINDDNFGRTYNKAKKHTTTKSKYAKLMEFNFCAFVTIQAFSEKIGCIFTKP